MKLNFFILAFSLFLTTFVFCQGVVDDNSITLFGTVHKDDLLLYSTKLQRDPKTKRGLITYDFNFESHGSRGVAITAVKVIDGSMTAEDNLKRSTVTLTNGGPGFKTADLHFESKKGGGIFKTIQVYGK